MSAFVARLRAAGLDIGIGESRDALVVIETLGLAPPERLRSGLAAVLVRAQADRAVFDDVFERFWITPIAEPAQVIEAEEDERERQRRSANRRAVGQDDSASRAERAQAIDEAEARGAAARGPAQAADYAGLGAHDQARVRALARQAGRRLARARLRRFGKRGPGRIDWPATLRASLRDGGAMTRFIERRPARRRTRLFVLADVSHSMQSYSQLALAFIDALASSFHGVDILTFTDQLVGDTRSRESSRPGSGTRIGVSLDAALARPAGRRIDKRTVALIVSDGWDAGDDALREQAMARLANRAGALYWLDPLMAHPDYFASAAGPQHESPVVDRVVPARSLALLARGVADLPRLAD